MDGSEASEEIKRDGGSNVLHVFTRGSLTSDFKLDFFLT